MAYKIYFHPPSLPDQQWPVLGRSRSTGEMIVLTPHIEPCDCISFASVELAQDFLDGVNDYAGTTPTPFGISHLFEIVSV